MKLWEVLVLLAISESVAACPRESHPPPIDDAVRIAVLQAIEESFGPVTSVLHVVDYRDCVFDPGQEPEQPLDRLLWETRNRWVRKMAGAIVVHYCENLAAKRAYVEPRGTDWAVRALEDAETQSSRCPKDL